MSKQNKFFAAATTAALVASAIVPVASAAEFKDANQIAPWAKEAVETLADKGVIGGNPDGSFNPKGNVTRAEAAKMFTMALNLPVVGTESFTDVKDGQWFQDVIIAVSNAGIVDGMGNGLFVPNGKLTRAEAAKMIVKAYGFEGEADLSKFADADKVAGKWFEAPLSTAVAAGIIAGKGNLLAPNDSITRQEFAVMLTRAIDTAQEDNADELLAAVEKATTALDTAVKALNTEVKADEIALAKAELVAAKAAVTALEKSVVDAKDVMTTELTAKTTAAIATAKKAIEATEAVIAKAEEDAKVLAVESVTAINANELKVTFSTELDKTTAETVTNYTIDGKALIASKDSVKLNADKKSVTIKFDSAGDGVLKAGAATVTTVGVTANGLLDNNKAYTVGVTTGVKKADGTALASAYSTGIYFSDSVKPTVSKATAEENGDVTVSFSERLDTATKPNISINGTAIAAGSITVNADGTVTVAKAGLPTTVKNGNSYSVFVSGAKDLAGNTMNLYNGNFTYSFTVTAPTFDSVTAKDEDTIELGFNKDLASLTVSEVKVFKGDVQLTATTDYTVAIVGTDASKYSVNLTADGADKVYANDATSASLKVVVEGYKDTLNNLGTKVEKTVSVQKDTVAPSLKGDVKYDAATGKITANFSEKLDAATVAAGIKVIGSDGVLYTAVGATGTAGKLVAANILANAEKIEILNNDGTNPVLANGTYTLVIEADTVTDLSIDTNGNEKIQATFTVTGSTSNAKPVLGTITNATPGTIVVPFTGAQVGVSATNPQNYKVNGVALPATAEVTLNAAKTQATITLPAGYFATTENRIVTVSNILSVDGVKMDETSAVVSLKDNTKPKLLSAKVDGETIILTFSEDVDAATAATDFLAAHFEVKVNGVDVAEVLAAGEEDNELKITTSDAVSFATGTITVKVLDTAAGTDAEGNVVVKGTTVTATR